MRLDEIWIKDPERSLMYPVPRAVVVTVSTETVHLESDNSGVVLRLVRSESDGHFTTYVVDGVISQDNPDQPYLEPHFSSVIKDLRDAFTAWGGNPSLDNAWAEGSGWLDQIQHLRTLVEEQPMTK